MELTGDLLRMFLELETKLHRAEVRTSPALASELIADDFREFGKSGRVYDKPTILAEMAYEQKAPEIEVQDFAARELSATVVLVTYRSPALRSSIWALRNSKWQLVFHQGTADLR